MLISLASGYGDFAVPAVALEAAAATLRVPGGPPLLSEAAGEPALREALAARYQQRGATRVTADHIIITPGTKAALFAVLSEVLGGPLREVLLPTPNWFGFRELVGRAGGQLREWPLNPADDYALAPAALRRALTPTTRVLLLSNPNNPTGRLYTAAEWVALLEVTADFPHLLVLSDEIYEGIVFADADESADASAPAVAPPAEAVPDFAARPAGRPPSVDAAPDFAAYVPAPTLLTQPDPHGQHVVVSGFSKSLALAGWGLGLVVAPPALAAAVAARQFALAGPVPAPSQAAALAATLAADAIGAALCRQLHANRARLRAGLRALPGQPAFVAPRGTYYFFVDFRRLLAPGQPPTLASAALVDELAAAGVLAVDGGSCWAPGFVRLSYAVSEANLAEALRRLGIFVAARQGLISA